MTSFTDTIEMFKKPSLCGAVLAIVLAKSPGMVLAQPISSPTLVMQPFEDLPSPTNRPAVLPEIPAAASSAITQSKVCTTTNGQWKQCLEAKFLGYLAEFEAPPAGAMLASHLQAQITAADYSRMMVHDFDFCVGTAELNARGKEFVLRKASCLGRGPAPMIVEFVSYAPHLADARRQTVLNYLAANRINVPPEMVVIGRPQGQPITGEEAVLIHQNLLLQTRTAGTSPSTGSDNSFSPTTGFTPGSNGGGGGGLSR